MAVSRVLEHKPCSSFSLQIKQQYLQRFSNNSLLLDLLTCILFCVVIIGKQVPLAEQVKLTVGLFDHRGKVKTDLYIWVRNPPNSIIPTFQHLRKSIFKSGSQIPES